MIELDEAEDLAGSTLDAVHLVSDFGSSPLAGDSDGHTSSSGPILLFTS
jgi:hypothetical protein